ncbi:hypothetical protein BBK14_09335 [Parafrankia soli]|uniref:SnoaL-like domain-containing protein n=1 Tax=Parafrankia soli TaxID=2599596 RepID=A0A1S1RJX3_9ACTN|nr:nuclear transport factor 2 family protein [Parafrankia soli]OHV46089.1 hypothetical protein BBK14_09335 [Parafrankia soli]
MIVPQQPARGFRGRDQEIATLNTLFETHPGSAVEIHRTAVNGNEVRTETTTAAAATGMEMAAVVIWTVDPAGTTISSGRYYSEAVRREGPGDHRVHPRSRPALVGAPAAARHAIPEVRQSRHA